MDSHNQLLFHAFNVRENESCRLGESLDSVELC